MPLYEYVCSNCKSKHELLVKFIDAEQKCPNCEADMRRKISPSSFKLKGSGWYKDGYDKNKG